jgi:RNA polymerase sigma-70 factor (ECF subfamily)
MEPHELPRIAHDPAAFEVFYRAHVEAIQRFVARRVADPYLAADLTADVFLAAIDASAGYRADRGAPSAWLFGVARNVVAAEYRRATRERNAHARFDGRRMLAPDDIERMQERIDAAAQARQLFGALSRLGEAERAVFELVALDDLTVTEAAVVLGVRPVTARVRLHRARGTLRRQVFDDASAISHPLEAS